jgi:hypothetical protein
VRILLDGDDLAFKYMGRDEERSLPKPAERKALPRAAVAKKKKPKSKSKVK